MILKDVRVYNQSLWGYASKVLKVKRMKTRINELIAVAQDLDSPMEKRAISIALMRIVLQHACVSLAEWIIEYGPTNRVSKDVDISKFLERLLSPSDGTFVEIIGELLVAAENCGWNISKPYWKPFADNRPCWRVLKKNTPKTAEGLLASFISMRNNGVEGHGLPGEFDSDAELDAVTLIAESFSVFLPEFSSDKKSYFINGLGGERYTLKILKPIAGDLICYRNIKKKSSGKCVIKADIQKSLFEKEEIVYEIDDILGMSYENRIPQYQIASTADIKWSPYILIPERLTDAFTGRESELAELSEWMDDLDSKACMIFGDGGIGKTTLTVEFLHRLIEGNIKVSWKPEVITYYTAKKTRWGLGGLEKIRANNVGIGDVALAIPRAFGELSLDKSWYNKESSEIIQRVSGFLKENGFDRDSHLVILDNTETMASDDEEIKNLSKQIHDLTRKVGRVILTSRRRESIEARPIDIRPLTGDESIKFLRTRALTLNRQAILSADDQSLKNYARRLDNKPLLLEVFVQSTGEYGIGLDSAINRVGSMQKQDLGGFLYSDAWSRMSESMKHLLLLMTRVSDNHDEALLKICCREVGISVIEANKALEESRGIANITVIQDHIQISFTTNFQKFCEERTINILGKDKPELATINKVKNLYKGILEGRTIRVHDRIERAYRHPSARAAFIAYKENRIDDCEVFYGDAINEDHENGWLYERFSFFLFSQKRYKEALDIVNKAIKLIPNDPDVWFTKGMIEGRLSYTKASLKSLEEARSKGKDRHLCLLQQAYAHYHDIPPNKAQARACLDESEKEAPMNDSYHWKFLKEVKSLRERVRA